MKRMLLPLSTIPPLAAPVVGATAIVTMLALCPLVIVGFATVALFPPATVPVATTWFDDAGRNRQHACRYHCKTQASHNRPSQTSGYSNHRVDAMGWDALGRPRSNDSPPKAVAASHAEAVDRSNILHPIGYHYSHEFFAHGATTD